MQAQNTKSSYLTVGTESKPGIPVQTNNAIARVEGGMNKVIENIPNESIQNQFNNVSYLGRGQDNIDGDFTTEISPIDSVWFLYSLLGTIASTDVSSATDGSVYQHVITENLCDYKTLSIESKVGGCSTSGNGQNYMINRASGCTVDSLSIEVDEGFVQANVTAMGYSMFDVAFVNAAESAEASATNITGVARADGVATITSTAHGLSVNDLVTIDSVGGATGANGSWKVASVVDADNFTIRMSDPGTYTSAGTVTKLSMFFFEKGTIAGLVAGDTVKFYEPTNGTTEDVVVVYVDQDNDVVGFGSVTSSAFTVANAARISLVPKTPSKNKTVLFTKKQYRIRFGDTIAEARVATPARMNTLTIENNRAVEVRNESTTNIVAPTGYEGTISLNRLFETVSERDIFRQRKPQACVIELDSGEIISSTDTNNQTYKIVIEIPRMEYETHESPLSANSLLEEDITGRIIHDDAEGYSIRFLVYNDKDDTYYTA